MKEKNLKDIQTSEPLENLSNEDLSKALHNIVNELKKLNTLYGSGYLSKLDDGDEWSYISRLKVSNYMFINWFSKIIYSSIELNDNELMYFFKNTNSNYYTQINLSALYDETMLNFIKDRQLNCENLKSLLDKKLASPFNIDLLFTQTNLTELNKKIDLIEYYETKLENSFFNYWKKAVKKNLTVQIDWLFDAYITKKVSNKKSLVSDLISNDSFFDKDENKMNLTDFQLPTFVQVLNKLQLTQYTKDEYLKINNLTIEDNVSNVLFKEDVEELENSLYLFEKNTTNHLYQEVFKERLNIFIEKENLIASSNTFEKNNFYQEIIKKIDTNSNILSKLLSGLPKNIIENLNENELNNIKLMDNFINFSKTLLKEISNNYGKIEFENNESMIAFSKNQDLVSLLVDKLNIEFKIHKIQENEEKESKSSFLIFINKIIQYSEQAQTTIEELKGEINKNNLKQSIHYLRQNNNVNEPIVSKKKI